MSDSEAPHSSLGGKSLDTALLGAGRPPYKSWRKKFRKMKANFDTVLEENKRLFKEEQKLEGLAKRLTEELDGLLEILLDLNQSPALPPRLRYNLDWQQRSQDPPPANILPDDVQPERANDIMQEYINAVQTGRLPALDLHVMREHIQSRLAQKDVQPLPDADSNLPRLEDDDLNFTDFINTTDAEGHPGFLSAEQEDAYLARVDSIVPDPLRATTEVPQPSHQADLTPRELERQMELLNPQSQHNWLKLHSKSHPVVDDEESLIEQPTKSSKKRPSSKNLARQVMMDRMGREGFSPSESGIGEDEVDEGAARKRPNDKDPTFRAKGGRSGGSTKAKRKRTTDEGAGGGKRMRASEIFE